MPDPLLVLARTLHYAAIVQFAGLFAFRCLVAPRAPLDAALGRKFQNIAWASLALMLLSGAAWVVLVGAAMSGTPLGAMFAGNTLATVLGETRFGHLALIRCAIAALAALILALPLRDRQRRDWALLVLAAALLGSTAWAGHSAAVPGAAGDFHLAADVVHLLAAGAWVGALLPLALLLAAALRRRAQGDAGSARMAIRRFSELGVVMVGALLVTGLVNLWFLIGSLAALTGTLYGQLLLGKIALFLLMVSVAAVNRLRLAPRLARAPEDWAAIATLRHNSLIELCLGLAVLAIVALLGLMAPGMPFMGQQGRSASSLAHQGGHAAIRHDAVRATDDPDSTGKPAAFHSG